MEKSNFIVVTGKIEKSSIILPVSAILWVFEDEGGVFVVIKECKLRRGFYGWYVTETMDEMIAKLGAA